MGKQKELTAAQWFWASVFLGVVIASGYGTITYTGTRAGVIVVMALLGVVALSASFYILGWLHAPYPVGVAVRTLLGVSLSSVVFATLAYKFWPVTGPVVDRGFRVTFVGNHVNMTRDPNGSYFFAFMSPWGAGEQISPVALMSYVQIESLYPRRVSISSYIVTIQTEACGMTVLSDLSPGTGQFLLMHPPQAPPADSVIDSSQSLETRLQAPLEPNVPVSGLLFFTTKESCPVHIGEHIKLRVELADSEGAKYTIESADLLILTNEGSAGKTITQTKKYQIPFTGVAVNSSLAVRRNYIDGAIDSPPGGYATVVRTIPPYSLVFPDGTYLGTR